MKNSQSSEKSPNKNPILSDLKNYIEIEERVRYSETDQMGVAHNKTYFEWFELGRTEYCRRKNISYKEIEAKGLFLVVVEAFCRYKKPLRYDDLFLIRTSLQEITPKKAVFAYELRTKDNQRLIAHGYTIHIVTNAKAEVDSLPEEILNQMKV
ncbi:MAG: thioesterase family protein [Candidatus Aminicenantales bacterium]